MAKSDYLKLSVKSIRRRGIRSFLTILGIFVGIASVVALISLGHALESAVTAQFSDLEPDKLVIKNADSGFQAESSTIKPLSKHEVNLVEKVQGINQVVPLYLQLGYVEFNSVKTFGGVTSISNDKNKVDLLYRAYRDSIADGKLIEPGDSGDVVLGSRIIEQDFGKEIHVGSKVLINGREFKVKGILEPMNSVIKNRVVFMGEKDVEDLFNLDGQYTAIEVFVKDKDEMEKVTNDVEDILRKDRDLDKGEEDFAVEAPIEALEHINTILMLIRIIVIGIAAISLLVGGIGIANTMYASILERIKEIGIMKSIGAKNSAIMRIFLYEAGLLGFNGGIFGAFFGVGLAYSLSFFASKHFPNIPFNVAVSGSLILGAIAFSFLIGVLSGWLPARKASKLNPVEALR